MIPIPTPVRQLALLVREVVTLRKLLLNRFTLVLVCALLISGGIVMYVEANNDGRITGTVVGPDGKPVPDAEVTMREITAESVGSEQTVRTDENGQFIFRKQTNVLEFDIYAEKEGVGRSEERRVHLHFRGENTDLTLKLENTTSDT